MPLDDYTRKRNFNESPEPAGDRSHRSPTGRAARFFCVQKHLASHLHYDFRLEHDGVLLSWAVPKGPSLDPATKRLAMKVEDHPIEYGDFEGVIPSGYGAGIVMLWDRGTWTPEVDDVDAALRKGDLKLTLDGYKLKGSWVLVRTKGRWGSSSGSDRSWLLIKHRDNWAGPVDIAEFAPLSVKSRGDFAEILAQGDPDIWRSNRPAQTGETGKLFERIIARALEMSGHEGHDVRATKGTKVTMDTGATKGTKVTMDTGATKGTKVTMGARATKGTKVTMGAAATKGTKATKVTNATKKTKVGSATKNTKGTKGTKIKPPRARRAQRS